MIGRTLAGYRLIERIGQGGMGTVYKARDLALDKPVALKVIAPHLAGEEAFLRRFRTEAQALARLDAPGIVRVHALRGTRRPRSSCSNSSRAKPCLSGVSSETLAKAYAVASSGGGAEAWKSS